MAYHDVDAGVLRIVDFRGDPMFGIENGQTMPLLPGTGGGSGSKVDPAPAILANPAVRDVHSFIGVPLELNHDQHFGTLCAIASETERFSRVDAELLTVLGRVIINELGRVIVTERERDSRLAHEELQRRNDDLLRHNNRLRVDAFTDALTGVSNRNGFERALEREWKLSHRGTVQSFLVLIDLDDFKAVNDQFGHTTGDEMLRLCAQSLVDAGRETDVIGRIGGDEFAAILVGCPTGEEAQIFAERAHERLNELLTDSEAGVTFSAGHQGLADAPSPLRAMELADQEMYRQKRGRGGKAPSGAALANKIGGRGAPRKTAPIRGAGRIPAKATAAAKKTGAKRPAGEPNLSMSGANDAVGDELSIDDDAVIEATARKLAPVRESRG
ncbi:MAG: sensor domain-containing diguanylate cyclase [Thermoleophilia bacterium]|nr:sensor domain-containing diguanylate cyclase [Thermoleophilia bacterium]